MSELHVSNTHQEKQTNISEKFPGGNDEREEMYIYCQALEIYINIKKQNAVESQTYLSRPLEHYKYPHTFLRKKKPCTLEFLMFRG